MDLERKRDEDFLFEDFLAFKTPEGLRAELIDGEIVVTPPPGGDHEDLLGLVVEQVYTKVPGKFQFSGHTGLIIPGGGKCPKSCVIPDATFALREQRVFRGKGPWMPAEGVELVAEVTSSRPEVDREANRRCYARARIPLYLLVDQSEARVTLFSRPEEDDYHRSVWAPFGKPLVMPEPFGFELDTSGFG
jgi:Uma2 family endonuclease